MNNVAFLDIETSDSGSITVTGIYRPDFGTQQLVGENNSAENILKLLEGVNVIYTYNGSRFDLPVILRHTGADLSKLFSHHDLMYDCWRNNLYGGLKKVEFLLGISRDTEGLTGLDALRLWSEYSRGDSEALDLLLRYNREDIENLELVAKKLEIL